MIYAVNKRTKEHRRDVVVKHPDWVTVEATPDGWIPWHGGECPLPDGTPYETKHESGATFQGDRPETFGVHWRGYDYAVIAYRPILDAKQEAPAWDGEGDKPPVGSRCMKDHAEVLVIAHANVGSLYDPAVVYQPINHPMGIDWKVSNVFSPIRSEEDRAVDDLMRIYQENESVSVRDAMRDIYRAGYRKTGGE